MQSRNKEEGRQQRCCCDNDNIALLTRKEGDWLLGKLGVSKPYEYKLKSSIKKKIKTFIGFELPLLINNNLMISYEPESLGTGFGDGMHYDNSSLGKASKHLAGLSSPQR